MGEERQPSLEDIRIPARLAGLQLRDEQLERLKPGFDFLREEAESLRERDLGPVEPAVTFSPEWK